MGVWVQGDCPLTLLLAWEVSWWWLGATHFILPFTHYISSVYMQNIQMMSSLNHALAVTFCCQTYNSVNINIAHFMCQRRIRQIHLFQVKHPYIDNTDTINIPSM